MPSFPPKLPEPLDKRERVKRLTSLGKEVGVPTFPLFPELEHVRHVRERVSAHERASGCARVDSIVSGNNGNKGTSIESTFAADETVFPSRSQTEVGSGQPVGTGLPRDLGEVEALTTAIEHLPFLAPVSLILAVAGVKAVVVWTTSQERFLGAAARSEAAFSPKEFLALAHSYETDRYGASDLTTFAIRKLREPTWRLTEHLACNGIVLPRPAWRPAWYAGHEALGVPAHEMPEGVTVGRLLVAYRARLVDVVLEGGQA